MFVRLLVFVVLVVLKNFSSAAKNNAYTMKWDHTVIENLDPSFVNFTAHIGFINRTLKAFNADANFFDDVPDDCTVQMSCEKWINNKFHKYSALQFNENCHALLKWELFDLQGLFKSFEPPLKDRWMKEHYILKNYVLNPDNYSPLIPTGYYKAVLRFFKDKKKTLNFLNIEWYLHLIPIQRKG